MFYPITTFQSFPSRFSKTLLIPAILILEILLPALSEAQEAQDETITKTITVARVGDLITPIIKQYPAEVVATEFSDISAEIGGQLSDINVDVGDEIAKDSIIASLDCEQLSIEKQAIQAQQDAQSATNNLSGKQLDRLNQLRSRAASSQSQIDEVTSQIQAGEAQLRLLTANMAALELQLEHCDIQAPFDGIVTQRYVSTGQFINAGAPVIKLLNQESLEIKLALRSTLISSLEEATDVQFEFLEDSFPVSIKTIVPDISSMANSQEIRLVAKKPANLLNGARGQIVWTTGNALPAQIINQQDNRSGIVTYSKQNDNFGFIEIDNAQEGRSIKVPSQLSPDDYVVTVGAALISSDLPYVIVEEN